MSQSPVIGIHSLIENGFEQFCILVFNCEKKSILEVARVIQLLRIPMYFEVGPVCMESSR